MSSDLAVRAAAAARGGGGGRPASPVHLTGFMNYVSPGITQAYLCARTGPVEEADRLNRMTFYIYANTPLEPGAVQLTRDGSFFDLDVVF